MSGWLKLHRGREDALALLLRHPHALALLTLLATRARYSPGRDPASGVELQLGEALTGRGDAALIAATPKQYRVCKDQLVKWGFVAISKATKGATWGTVLKLTESSIYEVVPLGKGHQEGHAGARIGPGLGHESRTVEQIDNHPSPTPLRSSRSSEMEELAEKVLLNELKKGRKIKNLQGYKNSIAARLEIQGGLTEEEKDEITPSWHNPEIEKTRKYLQSLGFGE